jgi:type IV pilus assembly protein PilF
MRLREAVLVGLLATVATAACSRLTFVRPDAGRGKSEQVAPRYEFRDDSDSDSTRVRLELRRARDAVAGGKLDAAEDAAEAALEVDPRSAGAHTVLAVVADRRGQAEAAGRHYARAAELAPGEGAMLNNYGAWLCGNGRAAESLGWFERALADRRYGTPASALANAGECAVRAGEHARAERYLRAALELDPEEAVALGAMAQHAFEAGDHMSARAFSQRRLAVAPASASALLLASQIEEKLGDKAAAARYVQRLRSEFPQARSAQAGENTSP